MMTRRGFLETTGGSLAAAGLGLPMIRRGGVPAPSDTLVVAAIGVRNQGGWDLEQHLKQPGVACAAICDVDRLPYEERAAMVERRTGKRPPLVGDFRRVLDQKDVDAVIIGTPDHWHCLMATMALEAGKHVYVEKPMANSIGESQAILDAARRHDRIVQVGQQQRSGPHFQEVVQYVRAGRLGPVRHVRIWANFEYGKSGEAVPNSAPPETLDFDLWLGPAPEQPYNAARHRHWRFQWDFGGGLMTDWGAHLLDIALWAMDVQGAPKSVQAAGGIFAYPDRAIEMPDTLTVLYAFDRFNMTWEHTGGMQSGPYGRNYGIAFVGSNGTLVVDRAGWEVIADRDPEGKPKMEAVPLQKAKDSHELHVRNFIEAIRENRRPNCPAEAGHLAAFYAHLGNIACRTESRLAWNNGFGNPAADALVRPEYRKPWLFPS